MSPAPGGRAFAGVALLWQTGRLQLSLLGGGLLANAVGIQAASLLGRLLLRTAAAAGALGVQATNDPSRWPGKRLGLTARLGAGWAR